MSLTKIYLKTLLFLALHLAVLAFLSYQSTGWEIFLIVFGGMMFTFVSVMAYTFHLLKVMSGRGPSWLHAIAHAFAVVFITMLIATFTESGFEITPIVSFLPVTIIYGTVVYLISKKSAKVPAVVNTQNGLTQLSFTAYVSYIFLVILTLVLAGVGYIFLGDTLGYF